jgi:hypothetical protein
MVLPFFHPAIIGLKNWYAFWLSVAATSSWGPQSNANGGFADMGKKA